jgi:RimJ/RimL family protein N-acetyltransferase
LFTFREVKIDDAKLILDWRTKSRITKFMSSDLEYDLDTQKEWLENSCKNPNRYHWIAQYKNRDIGLVSLLEYNLKTKETSWGYYIGEDDALGYGGLIPPFFYNFVFGSLGIEKIRAWVFFDNLKTIQMHLMHGYEFQPDGDYVVSKHGKDILIICLVLMKDSFQSSKYHKFKSDFPITRWMKNN